LALIEFIALSFEEGVHFKIGSFKGEELYNTIKGELRSGGLELLTFNF
jgi:hypothetical protein